MVRGGKVKKLNCWEFKKCGREPGGKMIDKYGICSTPTFMSMNGVNDGVNGGRICWLVAGTYGKCKADYAGCITMKELSSCYDCDFHRIVLEEEGYTFTDARIRNDMKKRIAYYAL